MHLLDGHRTFAPKWRKLADAGWLEEEEDDMPEKCWRAM